MQIHYYTLKRILNIYSQNPNSATSLPNTKFIFPKQIFYTSMWSIFTNETEVLALISVMPKLIVPYTSNWNCQMLSADQLLPGQAAWAALPSAHHGKNLTYWATILQLSWSGRQSRSHSSFLPHLSVPPLLRYRCTVHSHLCGTQNT